MHFLPCFLLFIGAVHALNIRDGSVGNCVGVKSCRPRCATFRLDRQERCDAVGGIFNLVSQLNPWDTKRFRTLNCKPSNTCVNDQCGHDLAGDLTIQIGEQGYSGGTFFTNVELLANDDRFTFCSIYPCTKDECALPEQMVCCIYPLCFITVFVFWMYNRKLIHFDFYSQGTELQFSFYSGKMGLNEVDTPLLVLEFFLKAAFVGDTIQTSVPNHYGPLHVEWMDDPTKCRENEFSKFAPVAPILDPIVVTTTAAASKLLFCDGNEYLPSPLPQTAQPTSAPSSTPTISMMPSAFPTPAPSMPPSSMPTSSPTRTNPPTLNPTYSTVGVKQIDALRVFYSATQMDSSYSSARQNWFTIKEYCNFTGVTCDSNGYVISIDLYNKGLAGTLPATWDNLNRLTKFKAVGNEIRGPIPTNLYELDKLTTIELSSNQLTGEIPRELRRIKFLRRLLLQDNKLNGTIHKDLCDLNKLTAFHIANNVDMNGEIPSCFGDMPLEIFRVDNVGLIGTVPFALCGIRFMNGLTPNGFGCDALACRAGTYRNVTGRMVDNTTQCLPCTVPSNVIGATFCLHVDDFSLLTLPPTVSVAPTPMSSLPFNTTLSPTGTWLDSVAPSIAPSLESPLLRTASPSFADTSAPSFLTTEFPSLRPTTASPIIDKSSAPSSVSSTVPLPTHKVNDETIELTLTFVGITSKLSDIKAFLAATTKYLTTNSTKIKAIRIVSQSVHLYASEAVVTTINRRLAQDALFVTVKVTGSTNNGTLSEAIQIRLTDFAAYVTSVGFLVDATETLPIVPPRVSSKKSPNLGLLGAAIGLSLVAVASIYLVRRNRIMRRDAKFSANTVQLPPMEDEMDHDDKISEESHSGWNSTASPGENEEESVSEWSNLDYLYATTKSVTDDTKGEQLV